MYEIKDFTNLFTSTKLSELLILAILVFLGVAARISIDIEISKKSFKQIKFFPRYFLALVLSYVIELYLVEHEDARKYYAEIIILFCIFVNDLIKFVLNNTGRIFIYILSAFTKGVFDLKKFLAKSENNGNKPINKEFDNKEE